MWDHLMHILEPMAIIIGGFSVPILGLWRVAKKYGDKHVAQPLKAIPALVTDVAALKHTLTVNGNTSDPPTILDRLQKVETNQSEIKHHLSRQDSDAKAEARRVARVAVATAADVKHTAEDVAATLADG